MKLTLLRHGETLANRERLVLGRSDVQLTNLGITQAIKAAEKVSQFPISAIYSSPFYRTIQTASYITKETGIPSIPLDGLKEMDSGKMEGMKMDEMQIKYPDYIKNWNVDASNARPPDGDTMSEVHQRAWDSVISLLESHASEHILAVTHLFPIQGILCRIHGLHTNHYKKFNIELGSLTTILITPDNYSIININDTSHLNIEG